MNKRTLFKLLKLRIENTGHINNIKINSSSLIGDYIGLEIKPINYNICKEYVGLNLGYKSKHRSETQEEFILRVKKSINTYKKWLKEYQEQFKNEYNVAYTKSGDKEK